MNVCDYLIEGRCPSSLALILQDAEYTYGDLQNLSHHIATHLAMSGAKKGDRVLLLSENSLFWVASYLGILKAGMVCVPLASRTSPEDLGYIVATTEPRFVFADQKPSSLISSCCPSLPLVTDKPTGTSAHEIAFPNGLANPASAAAFPEVEPDDLAALMFTSGSTGRPRGVMVSHRNIISNTNSIIEYLRLSALDRILAVLPFHYCFGTSLLHTHLRAGGSLVLENRFMYPNTVLERMRATHCTGFAGVPSHFQILLRKSGLAGMEFPSLRYVQQAGGQLAPHFISELTKALPGTQIFIMYGQTEATARLSYLPPDRLPAKLESIGKGIPGVRLQVLDGSGTPVLPGAWGEIVAEGDNIAQGYWRQPEESAHCFRNGKLYTGDLATVDADGFIYVVGRAKEFLKCGGHRVSCRYFEDILLERPDLLEAAVVALPDEVLGEAPMAYVVPREANSALSVGQLHDYCLRRMPARLVPKRFVFLRSLPKNSSGKVLKSLLSTHEFSASAG